MPDNGKAISAFRYVKFKDGIPVTDDANREDEMTDQRVAA